MQFLDNFLNGITMYRLVLYYLIALLVIAGLLSFFGGLPFTFPALAFTTLFLLSVCIIANSLFAWVFEAPTNIESVYISALILALVITPIRELSGVLFLFWAGTLTMASKYILALNKKHIFNPVALGVALTAFGINQSASWWVGSRVLLPFVLIGGFLIIRKVRRYDLEYGFFMSVIVTVLLVSILTKADPVFKIQKSFLDTPLLFFAFIMLTEPITMPPTKPLQLIYGALAGILIVPQVHFGSLFFTPELALITANIFSYFVSFKRKLILTLKEKIQISPDVFDFVFSPSQKLAFSPGQYMEWTLPHPHFDSRGDRRYFTIASSPTEFDLRLGVKFYPSPSSFKTALANMTSTTRIVASQMMGDFTLPKNPQTKLVFVAGGIGVTPYRSMIKYLLDKNEKRDIVLLYSNKTPDEIAYRDVFDQAVQQLGLKVVYVNSSIGSHIDANLIQTEVPDFASRTFYISGSDPMVKAIEKVLKGMQIPSDQIKTDYFPGLA